MKYFDDKVIDNVVTNLFDKRIVKNGDTIVVALSGGMDSICLLDVLIKLESEYGYNLMAMHIHHGIRGKEADRDLNFVKDYCKSFGIKLFVERVDAKAYAKEKGMTLEEAARKLRYVELENIWKKLSLHNSDKDVYVAVAHHMNDQAETVIHNIVRGTGVKGLSGMKMRNGYIIRPLLNVTKSDIKSYVEANGLSFVEDSTNSDIKYTRNFIRKEIVDKLNSLNEKAIEHIFELSNMAYEINEYMEVLARYMLDKMLIEDKNNSTNQIMIDKDLFVRSSHIIQVGIVREIFNRLTNTLKDIGKVHIEEIIEVAKKDKGAHLDLPYNITFDKKQKRLIFTKQSKNLSMKRRKKP